MSDNVHPLRQQGGPNQSAEGLPHCFDIERAMLGALLLKAEYLPEVAQIVQPDDLFSIEHREVFTCMLRMAAESKPLAPQTVAAHLSVEQIAGLKPHVYLSRIIDERLTYDAPGYARIVKDFSDRRMLVTVARDLTVRACDASVGTSAAALIDDVDSQLLAARSRAASSSLSRQTAAEGTSWALERIQGLRQGLVQSTAISTGLAELDRATNGGFQRGQLWLLAGRPGMGKSVAMTTLSRNAARENGALVFQCEITRDQQWARYLADLSYVANNPLPFGRIMAGVDLTDEDMWRLEDAAKRLSRLHLTVECEPSVSVAQIAAAVKAEKRRLAKQGVSLGVVFIDYLKFIKVSDRYQGNRVLEIGEISGSLKQLAKAEDICVVLLTQLNRQVEAEGRADRRPSTADLRDSGELEQDADAVLMLYREAVYLERKLAGTKDQEAIERLASQIVDRQHSLELILAKNRSGPTRTLNMWCDVASSSIAQTARGM